MDEEWMEKMSRGKSQSKRANSGSVNYSGELKLIESAENLQVRERERDCKSKARLKTDSLS